MVTRSKVTEEQFTYVKNIVLKMSPEQIKQIQALLSYNVKKTSAADSHHDRKLSLFYDALENLPPLRHVLRAKPFTIFSKSELFFQFKKNMDELEEFMQVSGLHSITTPQRSKFYIIVTELIEKHLSRMQVPVTPKTIINMIPNIPGLLDNAFPGYVRAGLIRRVIEL